VVTHDTSINGIYLGLISVLVVSNHTVLLESFGSFVFRNTIVSFVLKSNIPFEAVPVNSAVLYSNAKFILTSLIPNSLVALLYTSTSYELLLSLVILSNLI
jgi:hypothetical protein